MTQEEVSAMAPSGMPPGCKVHYDDADGASASQDLGPGEEFTGAVRHMSAHGHMHACLGIPGSERDEEYCAYELDGKGDVTSLRVRCECKPGYRAVTRADNDALMECVPETSAAALSLDEAKRKLAAAKQALDEKRQRADDLAAEMETLRGAVQSTQQTVEAAKEAEQQQQLEASRERNAAHARSATMVAVVVSLVCVVCLAVFAVHISK